MPIEIRITDANTLSEHEINGLHLYLLEAIAKPRNKPVQETQVPLFELGARPEGVITDLWSAPYLSETAYPIDKEDFEFISNTGRLTEGHAGDSLCLISFENKKYVAYVPEEIRKKSILNSKKPRKKRTIKKDCTVLKETLNLEQKEDVSPQVPVPPPPTIESEITYDELIAYILEGTRTKTIQFNKVMELVKQFHVPSINELDKFPHLINPFYKAIKEVENE